MSNSSKHADSETVEDQAIDWLICLRDEDVDETAIKEFAAWLAESPLHSQAYAAAENLFKDMSVAAKSETEINIGKSSEPSLLAKRSSSPVIYSGLQPKFSRPKLFSMLAMAAICLLAVGLVAPKQSRWFSDLFSDYRTQTGELRNIELSDGSRLLMNTNSAISVDFSAASRKIVLHHGQVKFTVAKDSNRPFDVITDQLNIRALGTVFDVYASEGVKTEIIVQEHAVAVSQLTGASTAVEIREGQQLNYQVGQALPKPHDVILEQATAWQHRQLVINDRPLSELIAELERYRVGRIFLSDDVLKNLRVTGVFSMDNPEQTLQTVAEVLSLKQTAIGPWWIVLHR